MRYQQIRPIIRPSKRAKLLPDIKYVSKEMAESMLIRNEGTPCEICNSTTAPLYVGLAFNDDVWPICCGDFCKYIMFDEAGYTYFKCDTCGKTIR